MMKTVSEFIEQLFDDARYEVEEIDIDDARADLEIFQANGWELPEDITPEDYMQKWNELVRICSRI